MTYSIISSAAPAAEIDVDVGQADALGVEEALEEKVIFDRVDVGDAQAVGQEAAGGRAAARADGDAPATGPCWMRSQTIRK